MIYHVLLETEVFSAYRGGAVARTIANIMRLDRSCMVVCADADDTWGHGRERILVLPGLKIYARMKGRNRLPLGALRRGLFRPLLSRIERNDIVWFHSQPRFCASLERSLHSKGARLIHQSDRSVADSGFRWAFRRCNADAYVFVSEALRQETLCLCPWLRNTYAIHNGADETLFYPADPRTAQRNDAHSILYVGRLSPEKGVGVLMDAMRLLQHRGVKAVCNVVGSSFAGGSKPTAYVRSLERQCPANVQFLGFYSGRDIGNVYRAADILCCPSICQEAFGNVNIEAMACGVPVVATAVGGIPEIAAEGGVILVEPNSAAALAGALQRLIEDRHLREEVATAGRKSFLKRFTWPEIFEKYQLVIESV